MFGDVGSTTEPRRVNRANRTILEFGGETNWGMSDSQRKKMRNELEHKNVSPNCKIVVSIETSRGEHAGVVEEWGQSVSMLFSDGVRGSLAFDETGEVELFLESSYHTGGFGLPHRTVTSCKMTIYWYETPDCPVCEEPLTLGMNTSNEHSPTCGWLCTNELAVDPGLK